jgi:dinuclear metal center YbgI/SA1388 family protein
MNVQELCSAIEEWAPLSYQESYDNCGLIVGNPNQELSGVLVSLDSLEIVVDEAIHKHCNMIVSHHPIIFKGLKSLTGKNYVERTVLKAIKNDIAIYAIHTNLDNLNQGVCRRMSEQLGLINSRVLSPKNGLLKKLVTYVPKESAEILRSSLFEIGASSMANYSESNFSFTGYSSFKGSQESNTLIGKLSHREKVNEECIELVFSSHLERDIIAALKQNHPHEEVAFQIISINNDHQYVGAGRIGELSNPQSAFDFLACLKKSFKTDCVRHSLILDKQIKTVALCGGAGSFLLSHARHQGADVFVSADFKYHEFFDAENKIIIADIGHYESERYTIDLIGDFLRKKFPRFAIRLSEINTNPINYL